ncbi:Uncharacterized protein FKW44_006164, partial [Caligus rogercresseyi]
LINEADGTRIILLKLVRSLQMKTRKQEMIHKSMEQQLITDFFPQRISNDMGANMGFSKMLSLNVRGGKDRRVRHGLMKHLLSLSPDVICLQDVKTKTSTTCDDNCGGCLPIMFHNFYTGTGKRGVLTLLSKKALKPLFVKEHTNDSDWHKLIINTSGCTFSLINAYGPNIKSSTFFQTIIDSQNNDKIPFVLIGDLNVDLDKPSGQYPNIASLRDIMGRFNLVDVTKKFSPDDVISWSGGGKTSRIDLALISSVLVKNIKNAFYRPEPSSDHKAIDISFRSIPRKRQFKVPRWVLGEDKFKKSLTLNLVKGRSLISKKRPYTLLYEIITKTVNKFIDSNKKKSSELQNQVENILNKAPIFMKQYTTDLVNSYRIFDIAETEMKNKVD